MIIDILKSSLGNLDAELVFTCPVCGRTFRHNDYEYPARWEDAIRKHLIRNHGGRRIGWDIIELPDDVNPSYTFLSEGGPASPPSHDEPDTSDQTSHRRGDQPSPLHLDIQEVES